MPSRSDDIDAQRFFEERLFEESEEDTTGIVPPVEPADEPIVFEEFEKPDFEETRTAPPVLPVDPGLSEGLLLTLREQAEAWYDEQHPGMDKAEKEKEIHKLVEDLRYIGVPRPRGIGAMTTRTKSIGSRPTLTGTAQRIAGLQNKADKIEGILEENAEEGDYLEGWKLALEVAHEELLPDRRVPLEEVDPLNEMWTPEGEEKGPSIGGKYGEGYILPAAGLALGAKVGGYTGAMIGAGVGSLASLEMQTDGRFIDGVARRTAHYASVPEASMFFEKLGGWMGAIALDAAVGAAERLGVEDPDQYVQEARQAFEERADEIERAELAGTRGTSVPERIIDFTSGGLTEGLRFALEDAAVRVGRAALSDEYREAVTPDHAAGVLAGHLVAGPIGAGKALAATIDDEPEVFQEREQYIQDAKIPENLRAMYEISRQIKANPKKEKELRSAFVMLLDTTTYNDLESQGLARGKLNVFEFKKVATSMSESDIEVLQIERSSPGMAKAIRMAKEGKSNNTVREELNKLAIGSFAMVPGMYASVNGAIPTMPELEEWAERKLKAVDASGGDQMRTLQHWIQRTMMDVEEHEGNLYVVESTGSKWFRWLGGLAPEVYLAPMEAYAGLTGDTEGLLRAPDSPMGVAAIALARIGTGEVGIQPRITDIMKTQGMSTDDEAYVLTNHLSILADFATPWELPFLKTAGRMVRTGVVQPMQAVRLAKAGQKAGIGPQGFLAGMSPWAYKHRYGLEDADAVTAANHFYKAAADSAVAQGKSPLDILPSNTKDQVSEALRVYGIEPEEALGVYADTVRQGRDVFTRARDMAASGNAPTDRAMRQGQGYQDFSRTLDEFAQDGRWDARANPMIKAVFETLAARMASDPDVPIASVNDFFDNVIRVQRDGTPGQFARFQLSDEIPDLNPAPYKSTLDTMSDLARVDVPDKLRPIEAEYTKTNRASRGQKIAKDAAQHDGFGEYRQALSSVLKERLGETFNGYALMSKTMLKAWRNGRVSGPVSVSLTPEGSHALKRHHTRRSQKNLVMVEVPVRADDVWMLGSLDDLEIVVSVQGQPAKNLKGYPLGVQGSGVTRAVSLGDLRGVLGDLRINPDKDAFFKKRLAEMTGKTSVDEISASQRVQVLAETLNGYMNKEFAKGKTKDVPKIPQERINELIERYTDISPRGSGVPSALTRTTRVSDANLERPVPYGTSPRNAKASFERIDEIRAGLGDVNPIENDRLWNKFWSAVTGNKQVLQPPWKAREYLTDPNSMVSLLKRLTPGQIEEANFGVELTSQIGGLYKTGQADVVLTGQLLLWSILSRSLSSYPHEAAFIDAFLANVKPYIRLAARGDFAKAADGYAKGSPELDRFLVWVGSKSEKPDAIKRLLSAGEITKDEAKVMRAQKPVINPDGPGGGALANLNSFGKQFLFKMSKPLPSDHPNAGQIPLQVLHDMILDQSMPSKQIRRNYFSLVEKSGVDNKILSFLLLVAGRTDVTVIDRVQANHFWDSATRNYGGIRDIYESFAKKTTPEAWQRWAKNPHPISTKRGMAEVLNGARGLALYEVIEEAILANMDSAYRAVGREGVGSIGRFHWESWVASSGQEVGHNTLSILLREALNVREPARGVYVREGKFAMRRYGMHYVPLDDGRRVYILEDSAGRPYILDQSAVRAYYDVLDKHTKNKNIENRIVPRGFKISDPASAGIPWFTRPGVDRVALDRLIADVGRRATLEEALLLKARARRDFGVVDFPRERLKFDGDPPAISFGQKAAARQVEEPITPVSETPAFRRWFGGSMVVDDAGEPLVVYHGTSRDFDAFERGNIEGAFGSSIYFSDDVVDVNRNYARIEGPDIKNRVDREIDRIESLADFDEVDILDAARRLKQTPELRRLIDAEDADGLIDAYESDIIEQMARQAALGDQQFSVLPVYLKMENPVYLDPSGKKGRTVFELEYVYDDVGDIVDEKGSAIRLFETIDEVASEFDAVDEVARFKESLFDDLADGEIDATTLMDRIREGDWFIDDPDTGNTANAEFMRVVFERMGFDGIVADAHYHFGPRKQFGVTRRGMEGVKPGTYHYMVFEPTQIKSKFNRGTFDPADPRVRYMMGEGEALGYFEWDPVAAKYVVALFRNGDINTLWHESGHLVSAIMGNKWMNKLVRHFEHEVMPDGTYRLTDFGEEQLADAWMHYMQSKFSPSGPVKRLFEQLLWSIKEIWRRLRGQDPTIPREMKDLWDRWLRPDQQVRQYASTTQAQVMKRRHPMVVVDPARAARIEAEAVKKAGRAREAARVDLRPESVRQALGGKSEVYFEDISANPDVHEWAPRQRPVSAEVDVVEVVNNAIAYVATEHFKRGLIGDEWVRLTKRTFIPRSRMKRIERSVKHRIAAALGDHPKNLKTYNANESLPEDVSRRLGAQPGFTMRYDQPIIELSPAQAAGMKTLVHELGAEPMSNIMPDFMLDGAADFTLMGVEQYNRILEVMIDVEAGVSARATRYAENISPTLGHAMVNAVNTMSKIAAKRSGKVRTIRNKIIENFKTSGFGDDYIDPVPRGVVQESLRELNTIDRWLLQMADRAIKTDNATVWREVYKSMIGQLVAPVNVGDTSRLFGLVDRLSGVLEAESRRLGRMQRGEIASGDEVAQLTRMEINDQLDAIQGLLQNSNGLTDHERSALRILRTYEDTPTEALTDADLYAIGDGIREIHHGLWTRKEDVVSRAKEIIMSLEGTSDANLLIERAEIEYRMVYDWFYSGDFESLFDWAGLRGRDIGASPGAIPEYDQSLAMLEMVARMRANEIVSKMTRNLAEYGVTLDARKMTEHRKFGPGTSLDRDKFVDRVAFYINKEMSWDSNAFLRRKTDTTPAKYDPAPAPPNNMFNLHDLPEDAGPGRWGIGTKDMVAYTKAHDLLAGWGFKLGKGKWQRYTMPDGTEALVPLMLIKEIEDAVARATNVGQAWTGWAGKGRVLKSARGNVALESPTEKTKSVRAQLHLAKAFDTIMDLNPVTASRIKMGVTTGLGLPNPAYYAGVSLGALFQAYQTQGFFAAGKYLAKMPGSFLKMVGRRPDMVGAVVARMWKEGGYTPHAPAIVTRFGQVYTDDMIGHLAIRHGMKSSFIQAETAQAISRDIEQRMPKLAGFIRRSPKWWQQNMIETATAIDNYFRVSIFVDELAMGKSPSAAADIARKAGFDYSDLTEFERKFMRNTVMFYSYQRKNIDLFWDTFLRNPQRLIAQMRLIRGSQRLVLDEEDPLLVLPEWMDTRLFAGSIGNYHNQHRQKGTAFLLPMLPVEDAIRLMADIYDVAAFKESQRGKDAFRGLVSRATPWVQAPFIVAGEKDFYFGYDINRNNVVPAWLIELDANMFGGQLYEFLEVKWEPVDNKAYEDAPGRGRYVATNGTHWWMWRNLLQIPGAGRSMDTISAMDRANLGPVETAVELSALFREHARHPLEEAGWLEAPTARRMVGGEGWRGDTMLPRPNLYEDDPTDFSILEFYGLMGARPKPLEHEYAREAKLYKDQIYVLERALKEYEPSEPE